MRLDAPGPGLDLVETGAQPGSPPPGQVLIEVGACAVCRTDLQLVAGELAARRLPVVPGHQVVGRIVAAGEGVDGARVGTRVGVGWLAGSCGQCRFCASGRENLCLEARLTGWDVDGGYATHTLAAAEHAHELPPGSASDDAVAPLLCGGAIGYRSLRVAGIGPEQAGAALGLYGFGASATLALQVARHWGVDTYVVTRTERERERAERLGATWTGSYDDRPPVPLQAAITFAPAGSVVLAALDALDRGGVVAINAIHLDGIPAFDYDRLWWERSLRSVANVTRADISEFLQLALDARITTEYEVLPLADASTALRRLLAGDVSGAFVLQP